MRIKGMSEGMRIASELEQLAKRMVKVHQDAYNAGAEEKVSDMWYDMYERILTIARDIEDTAYYAQTGRHYDGYGTLHGLDMETLKPLELNQD